MNQQTIDLAIAALRGWRLRPSEHDWNSWDESHMIKIDAAIADLQQQGEGVTWEPNSDGLLPCPFCGGGAKIEEAFYDCNHYWVQCAQCKNGTWSHVESTREAIAAWNQRTAR